MNKHQKKQVCEVVDMEGFDYAFVHYTDFTDIEDFEFHKVRKDYLNARKKLADLIGFEE